MVVGPRGRNKVSVGVKCKGGRGGWRGPLSQSQSVGLTWAQTK